MGYKHLGIEKDMQEEFSAFNQTDLQLIESSGYFANPLIKNRNDGGEFVEVEVIDCKNPQWWYDKLIGFTFLCRIDFRTCQYRKTRYVYQYIGVRLTGTKELVFRSFDPADVIII